MSDNSWYEKGELPPVDRKVVFKSIAPSKRHLPECDVIILAHVIAPNGEPCAVYCSENCNNDPASGIAVYSCFRPIKTERELAIEQMSKDINLLVTNHAMIKNTVGLEDSILAKLYDAGYRKNES